LTLAGDSIMSAPMARHARPTDALVAERALASPLWWLALALLVLNDHLLKHSGVFPGALTGKLSDVAGLVVAGPLLAALLAARRERTVALAFAAVGAVFAAINLSPSLARAWEELTALGGMRWRVWCDPTDLLALPALVVAWRLLVPAMRASTARRDALERLAAIAGAIGCMATSPARPPEPLTLPGQVLAQAWASDPLYIIDVRTGQRTARVELDGSIRDAVTHDGLLYVLQDERLVIVQPRRGAIVEARALGDESRHPLLLVDEGKLLVMTRPSGERAAETVTALDARSLEPRWSRSVSGGGASRDRSLLPVAGAGLMLVPAGKDLLALDGDRGEVSWKHSATAELRWPLVMPGATFVGDVEGTLHALDPKTGMELWRRATKEPGAFAGHPYGGVPLAAARGLLLVCDGKSLVAIDPASGQERWRRGGVGALAASDSLVIGRLLEPDGSYLALDADSGRERWRIALESNVPIAPVIADDDAMVLMRPHDDLLHGYDAVTGKKLWSFDLDDGERVVDSAGLLVRRFARSSR
jgi:outer membrane protein assembly factor BamB